MIKPPRLFLSPPHMGGDELELVKEAFASNYIAPLGPQVEAFERELGQVVGMGHCLAVSSGTAALHLALRVLGVGPSQEVIAASLTFIGGVTPAVFQGASPVFIDSDQDTWNLSPALLAQELERLAARGELPAAVVPTDIYGQSCDLDAILAACRPHGVPVVCDSSEALGATYRGRHAGSGTAAAVFSFNGNKIITTSGGGMLASDDPDLIERAKMLSQQARDPAPHYQHSTIGYNYRMSNILAAIGRGQLRVLDQRVARKREVFAIYRRELGDLPGIDFMPEASYGQATRWLTVITINPGEFGRDREAVRLALEEENIESRPVWKPMHMQPVFSRARMVGGEVCEGLFARGLCLPSGTAMTGEDLERVVRIIREVHDKA